MWIVLIDGDESSEATYAGAGGAPLALHAEDRRRWWTQQSAYAWAKVNVTLPADSAGWETQEERIEETRGALLDCPASYPHVPGYHDLIARAGSTGGGAMCARCGKQWSEHALQERHRILRATYEHIEPANIGGN